MYLVPGTWYQVPGTCGAWYQVPGTNYQVSGTWYQAPGTWYLWCQVPGTRYLVPGTWCQVPGTCGAWYQVPGTCGTCGTRMRGLDPVCRSQVQDAGSRSGIQILDPGRTKHMRSVGDWYIYIYIYCVRFGLYIAFALAPSTLRSRTYLHVISGH